MLTELVVEDMGVIDSTELVLGPGLTALTGETGAGKTLVVAALGLLLGDKADRALVRSGAERAHVQGRFVASSDHPAWTALAAADLERPPEGREGEIVVARTVGGDGRGRARVNGRLVTAAALADAGRTLVDIASQREHARICAPGVQRRLLDAFVGPDCTARAEEVATAVAEARRAERALADLVGDERARLREVEALEADIADIERAGLRPGEDADLEAEAQRLERAEVVATALGRAADALGRDAGAHDLVATAADELRGLGADDPALGALARRLDAALAEVVDVGAEISAALPATDPEALAAVRARLAALAKLRRRYGHDAEAILAYAEEARARLATLRRVDDDAARWIARRAEQTAAAEGSARLLSAARTDGARRLENELVALLARLALQDARVAVRLDPCPLYEGGLETVTLSFAATPGEDLRPLAKVASGGELSRVALALRLVSASPGAGVMVFDEVDAGVGGEAAQAIGRCLAELVRAAGAQVIVVTHLPQVAAFADEHVRVRKESAGGRARARVEHVAGDERVAELSRMLAGLPDSDRAQGHARELLELASAR